jgi:lipoprotein-anchoring transpeptidase ErfK/SrfK
VPFTFLLIALLGAVTMATANATSFEIRAHRLDQRLNAEQAAGVPGADLNSVRAEISFDRARWVGPLPYPLVSGAAVSDPFKSTEAASDRVYKAALGASRRRAEAALAALREASGPNAGADIANRAVQLDLGRRPIDFDILARRWASETAVQNLARDRLAEASGGLRSGLPADVVEASSSLTAIADRAAKAGIVTEDATDVLAASRVYLTKDYPALLVGHASISNALRSAAQTLQDRLDLRARAEGLLQRLSDLFDQADQYGAGPDFKGRIDQVRAGIEAARASKDEARLDAATTDLQKLVDDLEAASNGRLPIAEIPCRSDAPSQLIVIHLATQQLVAYDSGCPFLRTPVTTGRPALPTGRGTFHIFYKAPAYHMISPWPPGNPFHYEPAWVNNAMEFIGDGTFIHSASWQPDSTYGPGSQYGPYASHGCVHVLDSPLQQLYDWAKFGTTVVVGD